MRLSIDTLSYKSSHFPTIRVWSNFSADLRADFDIAPFCETSRQEARADAKSSGAVEHTLPHCVDWTIRALPTPSVQTIGSPQDIASSTAFDDGS